MSSPPFVPSTSSMSGPAWRVSAEFLPLRRGRSASAAVIDPNRRVMLDSGVLNQRQSRNQRLSELNREEEMAEEVAAQEAQERVIEAEMVANARAEEAFAAERVAGDLRAAAVFAAELAASNHRDELEDAAAVASPFISLRLIQAAIPSSATVARLLAQRLEDARPLLPSPAARRDVRSEMNEQKYQQSPSDKRDRELARKEEDRYLPRPRTSLTAVQMDRGIGERDDPPSNSSSSDSDSDSKSSTDPESSPEPDSPDDRRSVSSAVPDRDQKRAIEKAFLKRYLEKQAKRSPPGPLVHRSHVDLPITGSILLIMRGHSPTRQPCKWQAKRFCAAMCSFNSSSENPFHLRVGRPWNPPEAPCAPRLRPSRSSLKEDWAPRRITAADRRCELAEVKVHACLLPKLSKVERSVRLK